MRFYLLDFLISPLSSCYHMRKPTEIINSPSGNYKLEINFNENKDDKTKCQCIIMTLLDLNYHKIASYQTGASDFQKWAIAGILIKTQ